MPFDFDLLLKQIMGDASPLRSYDRFSGANIPPQNNLRTWDRYAGANFGAGGARPIAPAVSAAEANAFTRQMGGFGGAPAGAVPSPHVAENFAPPRQPAPAASGFGARASNAFSQAGAAIKNAPGAAWEALNAQRSALGTAKGIGAGAYKFLKGASTPLGVIPAAAGVVASKIAGGNVTDGLDESKFYRALGEGYARYAPEWAGGLSPQTVAAADQVGGISNIDGHIEAEVAAAQPRAPVAAPTPGYLQEAAGAGGYGAGVTPVADPVSVPSEVPPVSAAYDPASFEGPTGFEGALPNRALITDLNTANRFEAEAFRNGEMVTYGPTARPAASMGEPTGPYNREVVGRMNSGTTAAAGPGAGLQRASAPALPAGVDAQFNTKLTPAEEAQFAAWKARNAPNDSGQDYDLRGAFKAGLTPGANGHWSDQFKKPNHETFSNESQYAAYGSPGRWQGEKFIPPAGYGAGAQPRAAAPLTTQDIMPHLFKAESNGNQAAVSSKGARGIGQVMPATGPEAAKLAGLGWDEKLFRGTDERAKAYNAALSTAYFDKQMADFGGDPNKALSAYNAGPGAARAALTKASATGTDFMAHLPAETRAYVPKILNNALTARGVAPGTPIVAASGFGAGTATAAAPARAAVAGPGAGIEVIRGMRRTVFDPATRSESAVLPSGTPPALALAANLEASGVHVPTELQKQLIANQAPRATDKSAAATAAATQARLILADDYYRKTGDPIGAASITMGHAPQKADKLIVPSAQPLDPMKDGVVTVDPNTNTARVLKPLKPLSEANITASMKERKATRAKVLEDYAGLGYDVSAFKK